MSLVQHPPTTAGLCDIASTTVDTLLHKVHLEIFEFYVADIDVDDEERLGDPVACVPKGYIVFASPRLLGTANCLHSWNTCRDESRQ